MVDTKQARYADLIECCARSLAFDDLTEAALPGLVSELTSEAIDLRNGWADFSAGGGVERRAPHIACMPAKDGDLHGLEALWTSAE